MIISTLKNVRIVRSSWLEEGGRRLDCNPYMSGALEARDALRNLSVPKDALSSVTSRIFHAGREARQWVTDPKFGVPFFGSSDILNTDLSVLPLISKRQVQKTPQFMLQEAWTLITRSGTIGRMTYVRADMAGLACSEHVLRIAPNYNRIPPGYLYAYLTSKFGVPLVISGTYGAIIQHIEPEHVAALPVPRFEPEFESEVDRLIKFSATCRSDSQAIIGAALADLEEESGLSRRRVGEVSNFAISSVAATALQDRFDAPYHSATALLAERLLDESLFPVDALPRVVKRFFKPPIFKRIWVETEEFGCLFVSGNDIYRYQPEEKRYVSRRTPRFEDFILRKGWLAFQAAGQIYGLFGRPLFISGWLENVFCADDVFRIVPHDEIDGAFLYLFYRTRVGQVLIKRQASGNSIPRVWEPHISRLRVLWPAREVRERFAMPVILAHESIKSARLAELKAIDLVENRIAGVAHG